MISDKGGGLGGGEFVRVGGQGGGCVGGIDSELESACFLTPLRDEKARTRVRLEGVKLYANYTLYR